MNLKQKKNLAKIEAAQKKESKSKKVRFIDWDLLKKVAKGDPKVVKVMHELDELHHRYSGRQAIYQARYIRMKLRNRGIYLSKLGHFGPRHD